MQHSQEKLNSKLQKNLYFHFFQENEAPLLLVKNKQNIINYNKAAKEMFNKITESNQKYALQNFFGKTENSDSVFSETSPQLLAQDNQVDLLKDIYTFSEEDNLLHILKFWSRREKNANFDTLITKEDHSNLIGTIILNEEVILYNNEKFREIWNINKNQIKNFHSHQFIRNILNNGTSNISGEDSSFHYIKQHSPITCQIKAPNSQTYKSQITVRTLPLAPTIKLLKFNFYQSNAPVVNQTAVLDFPSLKDGFQSVDQNHIPNSLSNLPLPGFIIDQNHKIVYWNEHSEKFTGLSKEYMLGKTSQAIPYSNTSQPLLADLIVEDYDYEEVQDKYNTEVHKNEHWKQGYNLEIYLPSLRGKKKWLHTQSMPIQNNEQKYALQIVKDITHIKNREQRLQEKTTQYKHLYSMLKRLIDSLPDMVWAKDLDKKYIFVNQAICDNLLNAKDTQEPIGKSDLFFAHRERAKHPDNPNYHDFGEICLDSDEIVMRTKSEGRFEEFGHLKGEFTYLDVYKSPFYNEEGEMIGTVGFARDITKQKQLEKEKNNAKDRLLQTDEKYKVIFENKGVANLLVEKSTLKIILVNKQFENLTNYHKENIEDNLFLENIFPKDCVEKIKNTHAQFIKEEIKFECQGGEKKNLIAHISELSISKKYIISLFDITDLKKAEKKLKRNEIRYRKLFENMGNGAIVLTYKDDSKNFIIKDFNKSAERILNRDKDNVIGKPITEILNFQNNDLSLASLQEVYQSGKSFYTPINYYEDEKCSGYHKHYIYKLPTGEVISIFDNVSLQVQAEQQLQKQRKDLQDLSSQLIDNQENYRKSLARELHDEFGQELTAVAINLETIQNKISEDAEEIDKMIEESKEIIDSTEEKIRNLSLTLRPSILDDLGLEAAIKWYIDKFNHQFGFDVDLQLKALEQNFSSKTKINLFRIFQESLTNAMRHSQADCVTIKTIETDDNFCLIVKDDGIGFDANKLIDSKNNKSNYIGLLGMRERARVLGGYFYYDTAPGEGTKVKIELPKGQNNG